jgi:CelD/BcsL family acetyltransferase involved in cellulose biosynthesis
VEIEVVTTAERLAELGPEWVSLQEATETPYYVRHHFVLAWWLAYQDAPGYELRTLVVRNNDEVVGIAPFALVPQKRKGRPIRSLRFASHGDYMGLLLDAERLRPDTICRAVMQHVEADSNWDTVSLGNIPSSSLFAHHLLKSSEYNQHFSVHVENPYVDLSKYASFEEYAKALGLRRERQHRNRIHRALSPHFSVIKGDEEGILTRMGELHRTEKAFLREERERSERHSLFDDPRRVALYERIYHHDATTTFAFETEAGALMSYQTCYDDGDTLLFWNTAYDPDYGRYSVGEILLYDILDYLFRERQVRIFDLGAGRYPWKFTWTNDFTVTYRLTLRRPSAEAPPPPQSPPAEKPEPPTKPDSAPDPKPAATSDQTATDSSDQTATTAQRVTGALRRLRRGRTD